MEPKVSDATNAPGWGMTLQAMICERCDWRFLAPAGAAPLRCPHCFQANLSPLPPESKQIGQENPPELVAPFSLNSPMLAAAVQRFASGIPFPPADLVADKLTSRMARLYLPMWLVDTQAQANWQAETGYNYQVVSHQDSYNDHQGGWSSRQVEETRIRWEPRLGQLARSYHNVAAPALEQHRQIQAALGSFKLDSARPFEPEMIQGAYVRLPDRPAQDAWGDALPVLYGLAAEECRQAAGADHIRKFAWQAEFPDQHWSMLLLPVYATYYLDDDQQPQPVQLNGQNGQISGSRRASPKRARRAALGLLGASALAFLVGMLLIALSVLLPVLMIVAVVALAICLLLGAGALVPPLMAWNFNRKPERRLGR